ncbi:hypothetical protein N665_0632s0016 [Sinapis alba]|nr:hypothetical protein N665_0632s0016 [Sinapis alba]
MDDTELLTSIDQKTDDASLDQKMDDASAVNPAPARTAPPSSDHQIKTISANPNNYDAYVQTSTRGACVEEESLVKSKGQKVNDVDSEDKSATEKANKEETEEPQPVKLTDECTAFLSNLSAKAQGVSSSSLLSSELGPSNAPLGTEISKEKQVGISGNFLEKIGGAEAVSSSSVAVSSDSVIASTELEKNSLLQSSLDSNEVCRNASEAICGSHDVSLAHNSKHVPSLAHVTDHHNSDNSSRLSGGHDRNNKVECDSMTAHAENEDKREDKGHLEIKKRVKRRKKRSSSRSMTISQRLGAIDKTTADIDLGILDALEVATKVAQEVAREVDSGEASHSSSEELSDESGQSDSQDSHNDDLHIGSPSKRLSVGESHSLDEPHVGDDDVMDEKNNKRENGMVNSDDVEETDLAVSAKSEVGREKSPCGFDLNEDICPDETDVIMSVSHSGMPLAAPLQLERSLSAKGLAACNVSHSESPHKVPSGDSREKQVICVDLNVADVGDDEVEDQTPWKQFPFSSSNSRGGESSHEAKFRGSSRFNLDLNCANEDDGIPPPSELKMETRLFLSHNGQQSASPLVAQQSGKEVNFDLNDRPQFFIDSRDQGTYYGQHPWSTAAYGGHKLDEPVISILGTKVDVDRKETVSQMASFLSNGKAHETAAGLYMGKTGNSLGIAPGVSFPPAPLYGYNGFTGPPGMSISSSPMYVPGTAIPYMVDARGTTVMMPQIMGSAPYAQPPFPQQHMFMSLAGGSPSLNGSVQPRFDQSYGFGVEMGNRESLSLRQFLSPGQSEAMGEHSGASVEPSSSLSISIGGKRKEPETARWEFPPPWR